MGVSKQAVLSALSVAVGLAAPGLPACYGPAPLPPAAGDVVAQSGGWSLGDPVSLLPATGATLADGAADPGRVTLHRLNRVEYDNSVRDLLGVDLGLAVDFPPDDHSFGFDNIADVLSMSPVLMEFYERAAGQLVSEALRVPLLEEWSVDVPAVDADEVVGLPYAGLGVLLFSPDARVTHVFDVPRDGRYVLSLTAWGEPLPDAVPAMRVLVDQKEVALVDVLGSEDEPEVVVLELDLAEGPRQISVTLANGTIIGSGELLVLGLRAMGFRGPLGFEAPAPGWVSPRERLLVCAPSAGDADAEVACAKTVVDGLARRAWRRPLGGDERARLMALYQEGRSEGLGYEAALAVALKAILVSPWFLFRVELDPDPTSLAPHPLSDHELAARLAYFLWSSTPDEELLALADRGDLSDPTVIEGQIDRMLADPQSGALISNFVGQWLYTRQVDDAAPDAWYFPGFDEALRGSMRTETELYLRSYIDEDRSLLELLTADDTFIDDRLAQHYGLDPVGPGFHRVTGLAPQRGGLLRQASVLTVTSYPTRTSPVKRGQWVLEQLLCSDVPPPPMGVEGLAQEAIEASSLREVLAQHRADPACSGCHSRMDPIGLGMENYDGIGAWRDEDNGVPVEAAGELVDGSAFEGVAELTELLVADDQFARCVTQQLFVYALGRGARDADDIHIDAAFERFAAGGWTFRALAAAIATSDAFRLRRGEPEPEPESAPARADRSDAPDRRTP